MKILKMIYNVYKYIKERVIYIFAVIGGVYIIPQLENQILIYFILLLTFHYALDMILYTYVGVEKHE